MNKEEALRYMKYANGWALRKNGIYMDMKFKDFAEAMRFINRVASAAEKEGHHPDILLHDWNKVRLTLSTHAIKGLSINDFILAAKINSI